MHCSRVVRRVPRRESSTWWSIGSQSVGLRYTSARLSALGLAPSPSPSVHFEPQPQPQPAPNCRLLVSSLQVGSCEPCGTSDFGVEWPEPFPAHYAYPSPPTGFHPQVTPAGQLLALSCVPCPLTRGRLHIIVY